MFWRLLIPFLLVVSPIHAQAQTDACETSEAACVLDAAWSAALVLPEEKRERLAAAFLENAALVGDPDLLTHWEKRFSQRHKAVREYPDYGWQKAEPILAQSGVEGLIMAARERRAPLSFGRADALLSAGRRLRHDEPESAKKMNDVLLELSRSASDFEKPNLAHAAAELAMVRCDRTRLGLAVALTDAPNNLRYAFWSARISGDRGDLLTRVRSIDNEQDTREVRRVLDGYRAILELGYCEQSSTAMGG
ncbi:MAG: hypothetical protein AAF437_08110 [Pseudomonadota bacterium]